MEIKACIIKRDTTLGEYYALTFTLLRNKKGRLFWAKDSRDYFPSVICKNGFAFFSPSKKAVIQEARSQGFIILKRRLRTYKQTVNKMDGGLVKISRVCRTLSFKEEDLNDHY